MSRKISRLGAVVSVCLIAATSVAADGPPPADTPGLRATQVTISIDRDGKRRQFRATAMARDEDTLTILTAAHCLSEADRAGPVVLVLDGEELAGSVLSVVRNPSYHDQPAHEPPGATSRTSPNGHAPPHLAHPSREIPGPDNALARLRFTPRTGPAAEAFRAIRPVPILTARTYPAPSGQAVSIRVIDQRGKEHALRAGNFNNPRWLEWGPSYRPIPGDSGGGVFVLHQGSDGRAVPYLIGVIVGRDDLGGGASLVSRDMRWLADALTR